MNTLSGIVLKHRPPYLAEDKLDQHVDDFINILRCNLKNIFGLVLITVLVTCPECHHLLPHIKITGSIPQGPC